MDDKKRELLQRMAAKGLYIADLQAIDEYKQRKEDEAREKEEAKNSKDVSPLLNTDADSVEAEAAMSKGIQDAADKYFADNGEALRKLFLGLPYVKEASKTDKGKRDVENWLAGQLARGGDFYREILNHFDENAKSRLGDLRTRVEHELDVAATKRANWQYGVRGSESKKENELAKLRDEFRNDLEHSGGKYGRIYDLEAKKFVPVFWDVPESVPSEYRDAVALLMNLFDSSGLAPGSYSFPSSPAEEPVADDPAQASIDIVNLV